MKKEQNCEVINKKKFLWEEIEWVVWTVVGKNTEFYYLVRTQNCFW